MEHLVTVILLAAVCSLATEAQVGLDLSNDDLDQTLEKLEKIAVCQCTEQFASILKTLSTFYQRPGTYDNPALSCTEIAAVSPDTLPAYYWLRNDIKRAPVLAKCEASVPVPLTPAGLMKIADINMNDPLQTCPTGLQQITTGTKRACGRNSTTAGPGCSSLVFSTNRIDYKRVCGRIFGLQYGAPGGFHKEIPLDGPYIDGVSITHGKKPNRKHIWSFVASAQGNPDSEDYQHVCPCSSDKSIIQVPKFVGNDYFCESAMGKVGPGELNTEDPLWDGHGCAGGNTCCSFNSPPWFCKELPRATTDNIELRICGNKSWDKEDTLLQVVELYVQ